ncbi:MAG: redoxin domain-containing protein [Desulfuromonadales bacterium]|nr:redoxin domain-containing protein [Desulfuromonadales bacterium]NIS44386.1 redoxin domain-containing protein [Desulfuromonadales bacterium]
MKRIIRTAGVLIGTLLASQAVALEVGDRAPDFTAPSTHGEIALSSILDRGPVVLALYFADFTPG